MKPTQSIAFRWGIAAALAFVAEAPGTTAHAQSIIDPGQVTATVIESVTGTTADAQSVSGSAAAVHAVALGATTMLAATGPLADSDDARTASEVTASILGLGGAEALHAVTISSIQSWTQPDEIASQAGLGNLVLLVAGNQIAADFVMASATAPVGAASSGGSIVDGLRVNGISIQPSGAANERISIPGVTLTLNEVQSSAAGTTVNALRIATWDGLINIVIATATAGVTF